MYVGFQLGLYKGSGRISCENLKNKLCGLYVGFQFGFCDDSGSIATDNLQWFYHSRNQHVNYDSKQILVGSHLMIYDEIIMFVDKNSIMILQSFCYDLSREFAINL